MLNLAETLTENKHVFQLAEIVDNDKATFYLRSETYSDVQIEFSLTQHYTVPDGYSAEVFLFKNTFFAQKDIIELKISELEENNGRIGYFFRLDALFELGILPLNKHVYPFAYLGLKQMFSVNSTLQTKTPELNSTEFSINDFFDEDTIVLVACTQWIDKIPDFSINNYLAQLYLNGFIAFNSANSIDVFNKSSLIRENYNEIKKNVRRDGVFTFKISILDKLISGENFISHLYQRLLQKKGDSIARFITLYQIIEILISKILHLKVNSKICSNLSTLTSLQLKDFLRDIQTEKFRISALLNEYAKPSPAIETALREKIIDFFTHLKDPNYSDPEAIGELKLTDVFYDFRNKLVHNYRLFHEPEIDQSVTNEKMLEINDLSEVLVSEILSKFNKK